MTRTLFALFAILISSPAMAYIGPGLGAGTIGVILGVLGSIVLALFAIFWYPIKRMMRKNKTEDDAKAVEQQTEEATDAQVTEKQS